ncbi:MAG: hypothetical protein V3V72_13540 [Ignavibacteriaceae bacterium]
MKTERPEKSVLQWDEDKEQLKDIITTLLSQNKELIESVKNMNRVIGEQKETIDLFRNQNKELIEDILEFTEFLLQDYEMDTFDGFVLCWVLSGTEQKYSTKKIYEIWKELKNNKK